SWTRSDLGRPASAVVGDQPELLVAAGQVVLGDDPQAPGVELLGDDARFQPAPLEAADDVPVAVAVGAQVPQVLDEPALVLGTATGELRPGGRGRPRVGGDEDTGARTALAGLPRALAALDPALLVVGGGGLPEVPDVAEVVGGVPVVGLLRHGA